MTKSIVAAVRQAASNLGGAHKGNTQEVVYGALILLGWDKEAAHNASLPTFDAKSATYAVTRIVVAKTMSTPAARRKKSVGRPTKLSGGRKVTLYLDTASLDQATELGGGNVSEGIRLALAAAVGAHC